MYIYINIQKDHAKCVCETGGGLKSLRILGVTDKLTSSWCLVSFVAGAVMRVLHAYRYSDEESHLSVGDNICHAWKLHGAP